MTEWAERLARYTERLAQNRYAVTHAEENVGVDAVVLPVGSMEGIERLMHDLKAFGFGMGAAPRESAETLHWVEMAATARDKLREHFQALQSAASPAPPRSEAGAAASPRKEKD